MRKLSLFLVLVMLLGFSAGAIAEQKEYTEFTEITFLSCWNGGGGGFPQEIAKHIKAVKGEAPPPATGEQGVIAMRLIDAIYKSSEQNREVEV